MRYKAFWVLAASVFVLIFSPQVYAIPIDLNSFDIINSTAIVTPDGSSVTIFEDPGYGPVGIEKINWSIPINAMTLSFDYELVVASDNEDYFDFYFNDDSGPSDFFGGLQGIYSGTLTKDLTPFDGDTLPIVQFTLHWGWDDYLTNSYLTISNVQINPVPEPATLLLVGSGILGIIGFRKRKIAGAT